MTPTPAVPTPADSSVFTPTAPTPTVVDAAAPTPAGPTPAGRRPPTPAAPAVRPWPLLGAVALGTAVSVGLGAYGRFHEPASVAIDVTAFAGGTAAKAWLGTAALALVLVQLGSAGRMYRGGGRVAVELHRWSGRVAVLLTVPVAVHCLYALGYQDTSPRVLVHSLAGCAVYGAFVAKMLVLARPGSPRWAVPVLGGLLFTALTAGWLTSSLWFFGTSGPAS